MDLLACLRYSTYVVISVFICAAYACTWASYDVHTLDTPVSENACRRWPQRKSSVEKTEERAVRIWTVGG